MTYQYMHCVRCWGTPKGQHFCHRCGQAKPDRAFYRDRRTKRTVSRCIECRQAAARNYGRTVLGSVPRIPKEECMAYKPKVHISRGHTMGRVTCETCPEVDLGIKTREWARQHAAGKGHVTHFVIKDITTYRRLEPAS